MKILFKDEPLSIMKAALYAEFTGCEALAARTFTPGLFNEPLVEADDLDSQELLIKLRLSKKKPELWGSPHHLTALEGLIGWVLRHKNPKRYELIFKAIKLTFENSILKVTNGSLAEGKVLRKMAEEVQAEVRLSGHQVKLAVVPHAEAALYTRYKLEHNTADLVLQLWAKVYPEYMFVFFLPDKTIVGNRYGFEEWDPYYGSLALLHRRIAPALILNKPHRSRLASQHARFVSNTRNLPAELPCIPTVNYVDFYNRIKKGAELI